MACDDTHPTIEDHNVLMALMAASPDMIFVHDQQGHIIDVNERVVDAYGYSSGELRGLHPAQLSAATISAEMATARVQQAIAGDAPDFEWTARGKSGAEFPVEVRLRRIDMRAGDGSLQAGVVAIVRDIRERQRAAQEQAALHEQLLQRQKMESLGRFAAGVAHDFNNILSLILGHAELALDEVPDASPLHETLGIIRDAGERAATLTQQILAFGRKQPLHLQTLHLNRIVENLSKMLARIIGEQIELRLELDPQQPCIDGDSGQLDQVLMSLAANAHEAMPDGGVLTIITELVSDDGKAAGAARARLLVRDTGVGMTSEQQALIFEPFYTTKRLGTGLGLATVHGIVNQHGGHIQVESAPGAGSTLTIDFPAVAPLQPARRGTRAQRKLPRGHESLLIVDDEVMVVKLLKALLLPLGYQVTFATSAEQALERMQESGRPIDLLLTDVRMPGKGGPELAAEVRARWPHCAVLYMSGYDGGASDDALLGIPRTAYVQKPLSGHQLALQLRTLLEP